MPNNVTIGQETSRILNRVHCAAGWRGYYECALGSEKCNHSLTVTISEDGSGDAVMTIKKSHNCMIPDVLILVDAKSDMADMVKALAIDQSSTRAPIIAMEVYKIFETKYTGNFIGYSY